MTQPSVFRGTAVLLALLAPHQAFAASLSPIAMFTAADGVVQGVMALMLLGSVATWAILILKLRELARAMRSHGQALRKFETARNLAEAAQADLALAPMAAAALHSAHHEIALSENGLHDLDGLKERIAMRLQRLELAAARQMSRGIGILATIGSVGPFVGLFGTVWGIMHSFVGLADAKSASLQAVAPGIAEALLATALGLVAAIPATAAYNYFSRALGGWKLLTGDLSCTVLQLVSREASLGLLNHRPHLRAAV
ncbi:tonB-system energizer ExbB [Novosphingobium umbonatum]|uniref:Biopolymer transport protein ExbB n=1 Tax=Novosphingobium umbonatum TaxID=1908524 RepID=A0A437MX87_9SPHN|nr:tonB-system energizer ExbB [Novosphingobium umbonatum]RVU02263.1 tonB-system energizer ExbB [Novosphingobium umbonatum]